MPRHEALVEQIFAPKKSQIIYDDVGVLSKKCMGVGIQDCCWNETKFGKGKLGMKTYLGKNFPRSGPRPLLKWWAGPQGEGARPQGELIGKEEIGSNDATGSLVP